MMKKLVMLIALVCLPLMASAQGIFDRYEDEKDVTSVVVTKNMFKLLAKIDIESDDAEVQEYMDMVNNLISGKNGKEIISSWLVVIGVSFYIIWSIQNDTWVDPGVYSVMISMVAFGIALNINSRVEN